MNNSKIERYAFTLGKLFTAILFGVPIYFCLTGWFSVQRIELNSNEALFFVLPTENPDNPEQLEKIRKHTHRTVHEWRDRCEERGKSAPDVLVLEHIQIYNAEQYAEHVTETLEC